LRHGETNSKGAIYMPNWTSNTIRIDGAEADIRAFLEAVKWEDEIFDFNRIIPMPELLKYTSTGNRTINGTAVTSWYVINPEDPIPGDDGVRLFTPEEEATLKEIGYSDWYHWSFDNWGTKWGACRAELTECVFTVPCYAEIRFDTAWAAPLPILHKMIEMFPKLSFVCNWQNEGESCRYSLESDAQDAA
jgi:hypothetical protein